MEASAPLMPAPADDPIADAKDRLRDEGIIQGPTRFGNWFVPAGKRGLTDWYPGDPIEDRVMVRSTGVIAGTRMSDMRWGWTEGRWIENVEGWSEDDLPTPLPQIY